jgi:MFS family permease
METETIATPMQEIDTPQRAAKLWNRDFSLLIIGQIISIFGNMILTFALPLYILYISNSPALFGLVLGVSNIPLLLMSPVGGIIADRFRKQRIMFWLDATTTAIIVAYIIASGFLLAVIPIVIVKLMALNSIQAIYMPAVQAGVPALVPEEKLVTANSVVQLVNSFSAMAGMAIAGMLFARFGIMPILVVSAVCFAITAVMDLLIRIPFKKQEATGGMFKIVKPQRAAKVRFAYKLYIWSKRR